MSTGLDASLTKWKDNGGALSIQAYANKEGSTGGDIPENALLPDFLYLIGPQYIQSLSTLYQLVEK
jgi:hypothetical protein